MGGDEEDASRPRMTRRRLIALGLAAAASATADALAEPFFPEVTRTRVASQALPQGHPGVRLALLTDLHMRGSAEQARAAARLAMDARPDMVVLGGDYLEAPHRLDLLSQVLDELEAAPVVAAVQGNWEYWTGNTGPALARALEEGGGRLLVNEAWTVEARGAPLTLYGLDDAMVGADDVGAALASGGGGAPGVLVCHEPVARDVLPRPNVMALALAGHTHGGQLSFPLIGPLWTPDGCGRYVDGLYPGEPPLYVSRGVGTSALPLRFSCRPEVAIVELEPA